LQKNILYKIFLSVLVLCAVLLINRIFFSKVNINTAKKVTENILHNKEDIAHNLINSNQFLSNYTNINYLNSLKQELNKNKLFLFVYTKDNLLFWSDNETILKNPKIIYDTENHFIKQGNAYYIAIHKFLPDLEHQLIILIPVYYQYPISNQYLKRGFAFENKILEKVIITTKYSGKKNAIYSTSGKYLFSIKPLENIPTTPLFILLLNIALIIYIAFLVTKIIIHNLKNKKYLLAFIITLLLVIVVELVLNHSTIIFNYPNAKLFSSTLYASKYLANNLGVLLVRIFLLLWLLYLIRFCGNFSNKYVQKIFLVVPIIHFYLIIYIIENIIINSTINFNFFSYTSIDIYLYIAMLLFGLLFFSLFQILNYIFYNKISKTDFYILLGIIFTISILKYSYNKNLYLTLYLAFWLCSFILIFYIKKEIKTKYYFITSILIIAMLSLLTTTLLWIYSTDKEFEIKKKKIRELYSERDLVEEFELDNIEEKIENDNFIKQYFSNPYISNIDINDRILRYLSTLNESYIINTYAYDFNKNSLKGNENKTAFYFDRIINYKKSSLISTSFYHIPIKESGEKYIGRFIYKEDTLNFGYLYIELIPRIFKINSAYPELLSKNKTYYDDIFKNYAYAIYQNKHLIKNSGHYQYATYFDFINKPKQEYTQIEKFDYKHLIYQNKDKIIVVSEPNKSIWIALSVFSLILFTYFILFILLDYLGFSYNLWIDTKIKDFFINNTLQKQIQNYIILLLFLSLSLLAFITFVYFNFQYKNIYYDKLQQNTNVVVKNFKQLFIEYYPIYGEDTYAWVMLNKLQQRSDIFEIDINAYSTNGDMIATSNPEIYKNQLISKKINSDAYHALYHLKKSKFINDEEIGSLSFLSLYIAINIDGNTKLYLQFPHYNIDKYLQSEIVLFLISLINIYVFFLILIAFAAVFLSKSITNSLSILANHIENVQLDKKNELLKWNKEDEIGLLVQQYNKMLIQLEKSAVLLAKSEREGAWSEMAKQVAHEIKNPLTPMKLSIQHLQRALQNNDPDIYDLTNKISKRLIEQIDILTDIASAFSDFAKLPSTIIERIDILPILKSTIDLFKESENIEIICSIPIQNAFTNADKNQMNRVFTNLLKNAIQAIPESRKGLIEVEIIEKEDTYQISFKDNGDGIAKDKIDKIFEPNFTTKSSGTGLGLAICKNIIENISGKIWFISEEKNYTIFYLEIPKA
jgi:two-component system nitrogen regulation sensor histidine kinase NtrY